MRARIFVKGTREYGKGAKSVYAERVCVRERESVCV